MIRAYTLSPTCLLPLLIALVVLFCPAPAEAQTGIEGRACAPETSVTPVSYGDLITCEINPIGDTDSFAFNGLVDETISVMFSRVGAAGLPCARLIAPGATPPAFTCTGVGQTSATIERKLAQAGTYVIEVSENGANELLSYVLSLERLAPVSTTAIPIEFGQNLNGEINPVGDSDVFRFSGTTGESVYINVSRSGGAGLACIRLVDPDGTLGAYTCPGVGQIAAVLEPRLTKSGTFVIQVVDSGSNELVSYNLALERLAPASPRATTIEFGQNLSGEINPIGATDLFRFSGTAGESIYVNVSRTAGAGLACIRLVDPDGTAGAYACPGVGQIAAALEPRLTKSGTYVIQVVDSGSNDLVSYNLALDRFAPASPSATAIEFGQNLSGDIHAIGATDLFRFQGTAGESIYVNVSRTGNTGLACIRLADPDGALGAYVCPGVGQTAVALEPKLAKTGTYEVQVVDSGSNELVGYNLSLERLAPPSPAARFIEYAQDVDDDINPIGDSDLFFVNGTSGDALSIVLSRRTGAGLPCLRLIDPDGVAGAYACPAFAQTSVTLTPALTKSGLHSIQIIDSGSNELVGYRLNVRCSGPCVPPLLQFSTISPLPSGTAGTEYLYSLSALGGRTPYVWSISAGVLPPGLILQASRGVISGTPSTSGTFRFTVQVTDSSQTTASLPVVLVINTPATLTITSALDPQNGVAGGTYSATLRAEGGTPPYRWSVLSGLLPAGLALDSLSGTLSGTFAGPGSFQFTVQVTDGVQAAVSKSFSLIVVPPPIPALSFSGLTSTIGPAEQPAFGLSLASPYPFEIRGQVVLSFAPDAVNSMDDSMIQFLTSTAGRTAAFTILANTTSASFSLSPLRFQTGTVAGTITLRIQGLQVSGFDLTPSPAPSQSLQMTRAAPMLTRGKISVRNKTTTGFEVVVEGFSTPREIIEAVFRFTAGSGGNLSTTELRIPLSTLAGNWYRNAASAQSGSLFMYVQAFTVRGSTNAIASISVSLTNSQGESAAENTNF